ncbi:hypothetical protein ACIBTP_39670 [Streptomyces avidinii]|uniref:hypothetical protein n=1 Tax=Streptomyces TaxID=1883 RepID=UPI0013DDCEED|nr:hypothetical protein [Streptomyces sp. ADI95-16]
MTLSSSKELMAWQPPAGWRELSGDQRSTYLQQHGIRFPLRPSDWEAMEHEQRMTYLNWVSKVMHDTPESRAAKQSEYRKDLLAWRVLMGWWVLCLLTALGIVWGTDAFPEGVGLRIGMTVFALAAYTVTFFVPMGATRPSPPRT